MAYKLSEETLSTILTLVLDVPESTFRSPSLHIWGENDHVSTSEVLLVSKKWLRVATPLLYKVIVIRSPGQAHALADTLKLHQEFGLYIKQVRLEGAYSRLYQTLKCCQNLDTLYLNIWDVASRDSIKGLCRGLMRISPQTVIVDDIPFAVDGLGNNANRWNLFENLCQAIPTWTRLLEFYYPYFESTDTLSLPLLQSNRIRLLGSLGLSPSLQLVHGYAPWIWDDAWAYLASNDRIHFCFQVAHHTEKSISHYRGFFQRINEMNLQGRVVPLVKDLKVPTQCLRESAAFIPMADVPPHIAEKIWRRIFAFVVFESSDPPEAQEFTDTFYYHSAYFSGLWTTLNGIGNVCRSWRRMVQILMIKTPVIMYYNDLLDFSALISADPSMGSQVQLFSLYYMVQYSTESGRSEAALICSLLPHLTNIFHFHGSLAIPLPVSAMEQIAVTAGETLFSLGYIRLDSASGRLSPQCLRRFTSIKTFDVPEVSLEPEATITKSDFRCLATVNRLYLRDLTPFAPFFKTLDLPNLKIVGFSKARPSELEFLDRHGSKIIELDVSITNLSSPCDGSIDLLRSCTSLKTLSLWHMGVSMPPKDMRLPNFLRVTMGNSSMEKIMIFTELNPSQAPTIPELIAFFVNLRPERFPSLREIQFPNYLWPNRYHQILRDHLVLLSRVFKKIWSGRRIDLTDCSGKPFRERAQPRNRRQL